MKKVKKRKRAIDNIGMQKRTTIFQEIVKEGMREREIEKERERER